MASPAPAIRSPRAMKLGITTKAFLAVLLVALAVLLAMGVAGRWSFTRGFVGYMDELALQRVEDVTPKFVNAYAREGSWDFLRNNRRVWFHLTRPHGGEDDPQRDEDADGEADGAEQAFAAIADRGDPRR